MMRQFPERDHIQPRGGEVARISVDLALRTNIINAAYGICCDDGVGNLEIGTRADLVMLSENLYEIDPDRIHEVDVL